MNLENAVLSDAVLIFSSLAVGASALIGFRQKGCSFSEAGAYSLMTVLMVQSWIGQVLVIAGATFLYLPALLLAALPGLRTVRRLKEGVAGHLAVVLNFARSNPLAVAGLLTIWSYTAVVCAWPMVRLHGTVLERLYPLWRHTGSILTLGRTAPGMALPVLNHAVFTAPWQPPLAIATANLGAYLVIGFATYALCRRYAWPPMAITVTLLVVSMTRLVHQSLTADSELLPAAAALTAILALYRSVERPRVQDVIMLVSAIAFSVSGGRLCYLMPAILSALSLVMLGRRHSLGLWGAGAGRRLKVLLAAAAIAGIFSQVPYVGANLAAGQAWIGSTAGDQVVFNPDALLGTPANLLRYVILAIDLPDFIDRACRWIFGFSPLGVLKLAYRWAVHTGLDGRGAAAVFDWSWTAPQKLVWFGPAGFLLVIPSLFAALMRGPRRLKTTALAMLAYWVLIALIAAWRPENVRLMTGFFVCCGSFVAFALPPWRLSRNGRLLLQILGIMIMAHAILT
jgi:hypothetical protein